MADSHKMWCCICKREIKQNKKEQHFNKHAEDLMMEEDKNKRKVCRKRIDGKKPIHKSKCLHRNPELHETKDGKGWITKCKDCGEMIDEGKYG